MSGQGIFSVPVSRYRPQISFQKRSRHFCALFGVPLSPRPYRTRCQFRARKPRAARGLPRARAFSIQVSTLQGPCKVAISRGNCYAAPCVLLRPESKTLYYHRASMGRKPARSTAMCAADALCASLRRLEHFSRRCRVALKGHGFSRAVNCKMSRALQAAEKLCFGADFSWKFPAGAKALVVFMALTARLKSCPDASSLPLRVFPQSV